MDESPGRAVELARRGRALRLERRYHDAILCFEEALRRDPSLAVAHAGRGASLMRLGLIELGLASYREAVRLQPDYPPVWNGMANAFLHLGRVQEAVDHFRKAIEQQLDYSEAYSNMLFAMLFDTRFDAAALLEAHRGYGARFDRSHLAMPHRNSRDRRPLRIGYVSGDFSQHPVSYFIEPVLAAHDRDAFHITAYSNVEEPGEITARIEKSCNAWRPILDVEDGEAAALIRADGIDILVDLSGHTGNNRLPLFGYKPAPVQIAYLGYPFSTGLSGAMDYRVTDALIDPPGQTEQFSVERLLRLPGCFTCYRPPVDAADIEPAGLPPHQRRNGVVTLASFSKPAKWSEPLIRAWASILRRAPQCRLLLHCGRREAECLGPGNEVESLREYAHSRFAVYGVGPDRIQVEGRLPMREHLELYHQVDLVLDTFPYHGTTATCEALWMSVPVLSLAGACHVSRVGVSLLTNVGLPELVATDLPEYVDLAVALVNEPDRLSRLRNGLRERFRGSPAMDAGGVTRSLEEAFHEVWSRWCAGGVVD